MPIETPVSTIKFSQMTSGGDLAPGDSTPGLLSSVNALFTNPAPLLAPGSTADRPAIAPIMYNRLRFNTDTQAFEWYSSALSTWVTLEDNSQLLNGPFVIYKADAGLSSAFNLGSLGSGIIKQSVTTGISTPSIAVNGTDFYGPGFSGYFQQPAGVKNVSGNIIVDFLAATSGDVNFIGLSSNTTTNAPIITSMGSDTNIGISIKPKGDAGVGLNTAAVSSAPLIIYNGTGSQHQTNFIFANTAASQTVTFQDATGTVAFLSNIPSGTPSALTETNDTNVTLTLGGTPSTALLQAVSMTLGWTGTLSPTRGGTGINNGSNTLTLGGTLTTSGAFNSTFTMTAGTSVTFPTSGTLATTSQLPSLPLSLANGGTGANLTAVAGGIVYSGASAMAFSAAGSSGQLAMSQGTSAPIWTTSTYPATNPAKSILYASSTNVIGNLSTSANSVLGTEGSGTPSFSPTLPPGLFATNLTLTTPVLGTPQSGTLTNCTGLPIAGLTGLGTNVATALAANLNGSGALAGTTSPTFVTPVLGAASATSINFGGSTLSNYVAAGSFTPTMSFTTPGNLSVAYSTQTGEYTRIGDLVFYSLTLVATPTFTTASGNFTIGGLPISVAGVANGSLYNESGVIYPVGTTSLVPTASSGTTTLAIYASGTATQGAFLSTTSFTTGTIFAIIASGFYYA